MTHSPSIPRHTTVIQAFRLTLDALSDVVRLSWLYWFSKAALACNMIEPSEVQHWSLESKPTGSPFVELIP